MTSENITRFVREVATAIVTKATAEGVRSSRVRFDGNVGHFNFVWIMVEPSEVKVAGSEATVPGLYARTNDIDLLVGIGPSFSESAALDNTDQLVEKIVAFVSEKMQHCDRVECLLQTDFQSAPSLPNYVGNSQDGFALIHEQPDFLAA